MAAKWFCEISGKQLGPFSAQQLKAMVEKGRLTPRHRVRQGSDGSWVPAGCVKGLFPVAQPVSDSSRVRLVRQAQEAAAPPPLSQSGAAAGPGGDQFRIVIDKQTPAKRAVGGADLRGKDPTKRRKQKAVFVGSLLVLVIGLAAVGGVLAVIGNPFAQLPGNPDEPVAGAGKDADEEIEEPEGPNDDPPQSIP